MTSFEFIAVSKRGPSVESTKFNEVTYKNMNKTGVYLAKNATKRRSSAWMYRINRLGVIYFRWIDALFEAQCDSRTRSLWIHNINSSRGQWPRHTTSRSKLDLPGEIESHSGNGFVVDGMKSSTQIAGVHFIDMALYWMNKLLYLIQIMWRNHSSMS